MAQLIQYRHDTGQIVGCYTSNDPALLELQRVPDDPVYGYLLQEEALAGPAHEQYEIVGGQLIARQEAQLQATPNPFPADGVTHCTITLTPFQPCMLRLNGEAISLQTAADPLLLSTDVPQTFLVMLEPHPGIWADPLRVEAV